MKTTFLKQLLVIVVLTTILASAEPMNVPAELEALLDKRQTEIINDIFEQVFGDVRLTLNQFLGVFFAVKDLLYAPEDCLRRAGTEMGEDIVTPVMMLTNDFTRLGASAIALSKAHPSINPVDLLKLILKNIMNDRTLENDIAGVNKIYAKLFSTTGVCIRRAVKKFITS